MKLQLSFLFLILFIITSAKEYHVAKTGADTNTGTTNAPFLTIQKAAKTAQPGDIITVHEGVYRERINPPRGGLSDSERIIYRAAEGEKVEIKGSEQIKNWENIKGSVWKATISNTMFGDYNPYKDLVAGDWFNDKGRPHHTGEVYLNGKSLWEMEILQKVLHPKAVKDNFDPEGSTYTWYCESDEKNTYIYANFQGANPNDELVEINVRKTCFYPDKNNINYVTVSGFIMSDAATQWAPPTAEQIGLIGTNWSKGWIIENNIVRNSKCSGITLGKHGDEFDNTSENSAEGYVETIKRALARGWSKENIGSHVVRNNIISDCEQTGVCGSMGGVFSRIENNDIYNIWTKRMWTGAEMGGIKIHASIDMLIKNNRIKNCGRGLWLDWMAQGPRVSGNLFYNNTTDDIFVEVNHGPFLIENNILLSELSIRDWSEGGAYVHNLIAGNIQLIPQKRYTPFQLPHATEMGGLAQTQCGDNRYFNNIFVGGAKETDNTKSGLGIYENAQLPMFVNGNVYLNDARAFKNETTQLKLKYNPEVQIEEKKDGVYLIMNFAKEILTMKNKMIDTEILGMVAIPKLPFENPDGTPFSIEEDYFGNKKSKRNPIPGPFENPDSELNTITIWKK
ncbi:right-handed parallel beta-helix repeat-containing protein [Prolixibacteraceae bacterium Z1-6]|uniref:Right-handed parallel beta-helix repeat-containing protein n=1 Tax=Draconibacterium aestuarii TaxID=2998507 RepID=A0A9X3F7Q9_9BACT|nr:right-handed parallel beta-helix repeat-containing protein [Prolixibacteraceae bacterium Z1-6]